MKNGNDNQHTDCRPDIEVQKEYLERNPFFKSTYQPGDGNMAMLYISDATVRYFAFPGPEEERRTQFGSSEI